MRTEQEAFWAGEFGDEYIQRNTSQNLIASNIGNFSKVFVRTGRPRTLIEFGANAGNNLKAIRALSPLADLAAVEINHKAAEALREWGGCQVYEQSILDFEPSGQWDIALIKGVLIHINPDRLQEVYSKLYSAASRYVVIWEYHNPTPVEVPYRGHSGKLFKRDFAGEMLDLYPDLKLVDYGFIYHLDPTFPMDDSNWFVLEKR